MFFSQTFNELILFNGDMEGHMGFVLVYSKAADISVLETALESEKDLAVASSAKNLQMMYSPKHFIDNTLPNAIKSSIYGEATFDGCLIPFISSFGHIFVTSKGLHYVLSLFSQADLPDDGGCKSIDFLLGLIDLIGIVFKSAPQLQESMVENNGFDVMAYFLTQIEPSFICNATFDHIFMLEPLITNSELLRQYQTAIILNPTLWFRAETPLYHEFMVCMEHAAVSHPAEFQESMDFNNLIELYYRLQDEERFRFESRVILQRVMVYAMKGEFGESEVNGIYKLMEEFNKEKDVILVFKAVLEVTKVKNKCWKLIFSHQIPKLEMPKIGYLLAKNITKEFFPNFLFCILSMLENAKEEERKLIFQYFREKCKKGNVRTSVFTTFLSLAYSLTDKSSETVGVIKGSFDRRIFEETETSGLVVIILYFAFVLGETKILTDALGSDIKTVNVFLSAVEMVSDVSMMDFTGFTSKALRSIIQQVFEKDEKQIMAFFDYFVSFVFFGPNRSLEDNLQLPRPAESIQLPSFLLLMSMDKKSEKNVYGIRLTSKGGFAYERISMEIVQQMIQKFGAQICNRESFVVLLNFLFSHNFNPDKTDIMKPIYQSLLTSKYASIILPFFVANGYVEKLIVSTVTAQFEHMEEFVRKTKRPSVVFSISEHLEVSLEKGKSLEAIIGIARKSQEDNVKTYRRGWRKLWLNISHKRSPFLDADDTVEHFKRGSHFDIHFTPTLMAPNRHFNPHIDAHKNSGAQGEEEIKEQSGHFFFDRDRDTNPSDTAIKKSLWSGKAERIKIMSSKKGEFHILKDEFVFISDSKTIRIRGKTVTHIFWCWIMQRNRGIQIFTNEYRCFLFDFADVENKKVVSLMKQTSMPNLVFAQESVPSNEVERLNLTSKWQKWQISTFDYLIWLNMLSGRSFLDSRIYPIFPLLIKSADCEKVDPMDKSIMRDLTKHVGFLNAANMERISERVRMLRSTGQHAYAHAAYISNPYIVNHFLMRIEPFTSLHIVLQDGHFDCTARLFISIRDMLMRMQSTMGSIREITPEFFSQPEFMLNEDGFDFGELDGRKLGDAGLPRWASSACEFVHINRQALESVQNIGGWIDLVWGYKSFGRAAVEEMNTYDPSIYPDVWTKAQDEFFADDAAIAMMNSIGQCPQLLFTGPHPSRAPAPAAEAQPHAIVLQNLPASVVAFKCFGATLEKMKVYVVVDGRRVFCLRLSSTNFEINIQNTAKVFAKKPNLAAYVKTPNSDDVVFAYALPNSANVSILSTERRMAMRSTESPHLSGIVCLSADQDVVVTGGKDACVVLWRITADAVRHVNILLAHSTPVTAVAVSKGFGVVVSCSANGTMIISTLPGLEFLRAVDLEKSSRMEEPETVLVSPMDGTIVVFSGALIQNFTINGLKINRAELKSPVISACFAAPHPASQFVVVLCADSSILMLDTFSLAVAKVIWRATTKGRAISFHEVTQNLVLTTEEATVILIPVGFP